MRPLIGITCSADDHGRPVVRPPYVAAVHRAGGLPVALPFVSDEAEARQLLARLDGVVLTGSEDLDSALWDEPLHPAVTVMHPDRHATELAVCRALLHLDLPTLGICGGMQTLNVVAGGTILQHLPDAGLGDGLLDHAVGVEGPHHAVQAEAGTRTAELLGERFETNTAHHQGLGRLGEGVVVTARCPDGVVEAFEMPAQRHVLCVQWHPERMPYDPRQQALFASLVSAAAPAAAV